MRSCLVLGSGRSGTSLTAGVIAGAGHAMGEGLHRARAANPKGFFESEEINGINEDLLAAVAQGGPGGGQGQRWLVQLPLDVALAAPAEIVDRIRQAVRHVPFCYKDPRFSYTLPVWRPHLGDAGLVCVFRHPALTAQSMVEECRSAAYLEDLRIDHEEALAVWEANYLQILRRHRREGDWLFVHKDQMLEPAGLDRLAAFLDAPAIDRAFGDRALNRPVPDLPVPARMLDLYAELCELAGFRAETPAATAAGARAAGSAPPAPDVSAVAILDEGDRETLAGLARQIEAQRGVAAELIVVDRTAAGLSAVAGVRLVRDGSGDRARAHLAALEVAAGRHVAWVDPACRLLPWHLAHVVEALENRPDAGMVVSPFNLSDERGQFWKRIDPLDDPVSPPAFWRAGAAVRREILTGVRPRPLVPVELALLRRLAAAGRVVGAAEPGFHVPLSAFEACRPRSAGEAALLEALERAEGGAVDLSLVVLASEGGAMLRETLDRLLEGLPGDLGLEVVIVDCGGGVAALAPPAGEIPTGGGPPAPAGSSALRIAPGVHADPVAARRAGCAAARGELLLLVEDRHEPGPGLVAAHVAAHAAARRDGGVAAVVAGETRSPADGERALLGRYLDRTGRADLRAVGRPEGRVPGLSLRSWNLSLPRALLAAAGGHDASLPDLECSDAELGRRLAGAGARFVPCPGAVVRARTQPGFEDFGRRVEEAAAARIALLARHPELLPGYRCRTLSVPVLAEIQERRRALIASLEAALRALATVDLSPLEGFAETAALAAQLGERFGTLMPVMEELWCGRGYLRGLRELDRELIEVPAAACR